MVKCFLVHSLSENPQHCCSQSICDPYHLWHNSGSVISFWKVSVSPIYFWGQLVFKLICFHHFGEVLLFGNTLVGAIARLSNGRDEVQAVRLHLQTRAAVTIVLPCVHSMIRVYGTWQIKRDTQGDWMNCVQIHWWFWSCVPLFPLYLLLF